MGLEVCRSQGMGETPATNGEPEIRTMTVPRLYTLAEASATLLHGRVSRRTLSEEIRSGRLEATFLGGRYLVTEEAVVSMIAANRGRAACHDQGNLRGSGSAKREPATPRHGSSSTADASIRQAAAQESLRQLKKPSRDTSPGATVHRLPASSRTSTSQT